MFAWWGWVAVRRRWTVLGAALAFAVAGVAWGTGVFGALTSGGFEDPASESARAYERITDQLGSQDPDLLVLYSSDTATVDSSSFADAVTGTLAQVHAQPEVASVTSWYDTQSPALVSEDRRSTYAVVRLEGADEDAKIEAYEAIEPMLAAPGLDTQVGGLVGFGAQTDAQAERDIVRAELVALPLLLVLLVFIFRGVVAALMPLLVGMLAVLGGLLATRLLTFATDISVFAINIITVIGLGMAIDYALFVVSRFREELASGHSTGWAVRQTIATAGRTVLVSGLTIALALSSLLVFPQGFLRSMAFGGMSAVLVAMVASLTVLPALLAVLGPRINAGQIRLRRRRAATDETAGGWARLARSVMRRPVVFAVSVVAVLLVLAVPALRIELGGFDIRVLPEGAEARQVNEALDEEFGVGCGDGQDCPPEAMTDPITVLVAGASTGQVQTFAEQVTALPQVTGAAVTAENADTTLLAVAYPGEPTGDAAEAVVRAIRDLPAPAGTEVLVGGRTARDLDLLDSLGERLPWMALLVVATILVVLFLAFGSVVLPFKAIVMSLISIGASFGVVVWVFQDGNLSGVLGFTPTGFIEPTMPILMLAILFGLSTDYEVFLLSRVREEWDRTGDNTRAVALGLQRTGQIITAAALLLVIVVGGFATGEMAFIKLIGIGMIVAIVVDATLVRALLVPATMRLLGRWNWWAPGPLGRLYRRYGLREEPESKPAQEPARPELTRT